MAQITLNTKLTSEAFTINDDDIINVSTLYIDGVASGSKLTIIDTASVIDQTIEVEETPSAIAALTTKLFQVTLTSKETPYLNIGRVKDVVTNSDALADIRYDSNGNVFQTLKTSMTLAAVLAAINTGGNIPLVYKALLTQSGTSAPTAAVLENSLGGTLVWTYDAVGQYTGTLAGVFTADKTFLMINNQAVADNRGINLVRVNADTIQINIARITTGVTSDDVLSNTAIEILIYP